MTDHFLSMMEIYLKFVPTSIFYDHYVFSLLCLSYDRVSETLQSAYPYQKKCQLFNSSPQETAQQTLQKYSSG